MAFDGSSWPVQQGGWLAPPPVKPKTGTGNRRKDAERRRERRNRPPPGRPGYSGDYGPAPERKPKYFGPQRTPARVPFGKKKPRPQVAAKPWGWLPVPFAPLFDPFSDLPQFLAPTDPRDYTVEVPPGWTHFLECPKNDLYMLPPGVAHFRGPASPLPTCLTLQAGFTPGVSTYAASWPNCTVVNNRNNIVIADTREVSPGQYRGHYRHVLRIACSGSNPQWADLDGRTLIRPPVPAVVWLPNSEPDPFALARPGFAQPYPKPIPYTELPYYPDPDPEILPGTAPVSNPLPEWDWLEPLPGVHMPVPAAQPLPVPGPGWQPQPLPYPPLPLPGPEPTPAPMPLPPYYIPAVAVGLEVGTKVRELPLWPMHRLTQPKRGEKEFKARMGPVLSTLWGMTGALTEAMDLVEVLYNAIPCQVKYDGGMMVKGRRVGFHNKAAFVAANAKHVNMREVIRGGSKNAFEDRVYGFLSAEKAQYQGSFNAGINTRGGNSIQKRDAWNPDVGEELPVIGAFNAGVDALLGPRPREFSCCAGKKVVCQHIAFRQNRRTSYKIGKIFGRKAQQSFWIAAKKKTKYKRNAYSQARAGYIWQPQRSGRVQSEVWKG